MPRLQQEFEPLMNASYSRNEEATDIPNALWHMPLYVESSFTEVEAGCRALAGRPACAQVM